MDNIELSKGFWNNVGKVLGFMSDEPVIGEGVSSENEALLGHAAVEDMGSDSTGASEVDTSSVDVESEHGTYDGSGLSPKNRYHPSSFRGKSISGKHPLITGVSDSNISRDLKASADGYKQILAEIELLLEESGVQDYYRVDSLGKPTMNVPAFYDRIVDGEYSELFKDWAHSYGEFYIPIVEGINQAVKKAKSQGHKESDLLNKLSFVLSSDTGGEVDHKRFVGTKDDIFNEQAILKPDIFGMSVADALSSVRGKGGDDSVIESIKAFLGDFGSEEEDRIFNTLRGVADNVYTIMRSDPNDYTVRIYAGEQLAQYMSHMYSLGLGKAVNTASTTRILSKHSLLDLSSMSDRELIQKANNIDLEPLTIEDAYSFSYDEIVNMSKAITYLYMREHNLLNHIHKSSSLMTNFMKIDSNLLPEYEIEEDSDFKGIESIVDTIEHQPADAKFIDIMMLRLAMDKYVNKCIGELSE